MSATGSGGGVPSAGPAVDQTAPLYTSFSNPVYSLATRGPPGSEPGSGAPGRATLNLVTYASPIAIKPVRCFALGLYRGTLSWENFRETRAGVLQVLQGPHARLFHLLGKTSGRDVDKLEAVRAEGFGLEEHFGYTTLAGAACHMELAAASELIPCGDHDVVICEVRRFVNLVDPGSMDALYTGTLRELGYM